MQVVKEQWTLDVRKYLFSQREIIKWNKLSTNIVKATSDIMSKNRLINL